MNRNSSLRLLAALILTATLSAAAQDTNSPYSRFGYGLLRDGATSAQQQMGGVGYAMNSGRQINVMNPASYSNIDSLTFLFDMGVNINFDWMNDNGAKHKYTGGGLDYVTMQFPIGKRLGMSLGLLPYSSVGYNFGNTIDNGIDMRIGSGGLNELYLGISGRLFRGASIGANVSYLFGTTYNQSNVTSDISTTTIFLQTMEVRDWHVNLGAQYSFNAGRRNRFTLGLTYSPGKTLLGHTMVTTSEQASSSTVTVRDTVLYTSLKDKFGLPDTWGVGVNWEWDRRLMVEADFTWQGWKNAKYTELDNFIYSRFDNRWKVGLGAQYTPKLRGNYVQRINYRAGAYFNHDYLVVQGNNVREWGVSCGFGLPAPGQKTVINLGFQYLKRQAHPNPLLKESYFQITLGVNFNEMWFWKSKIR